MVSACLGGALLAAAPSTYAQAAETGNAVRIERLEELGHELRRPEADLLRNGIYELRVGLQHVNYRMLYFFHGRTAAVVSHGLVKEAVVPNQEIEKALERKRKFEKNPKAHTYEE